jgi:hypothetical protein
MTRSTIMELAAGRRVRRALDRVGALRVRRNEAVATVTGAMVDEATRPERSAPASSASIAPGRVLVHQTRVHRRRTEACALDGGRMAARPARGRRIGAVDRSRTRVARVRKVETGGHKAVPAAPGRGTLVRETPAHGALALGTPAHAEVVHAMLVRARVGRAIRGDATRVHQTLLGAKVARATLAPRDAQAKRSSLVLPAARGALGRQAPVLVAQAVHAAAGLRAPSRRNGRMAARPRAATVR